jgi:hypothetical protein
MSVLAGIVDSHVHSSPDAVPRLMTDLEVARGAADAGYRAVVLKSHHTVTAARATLVDECVSGVQVLGGLAINLQSTGGMNPLAVEASLAMGASVIWMPTITSAAQLRVLASGGGDRLIRNMTRHDLEGISVLDGQGRLTGETVAVLELVAEHDATLATGHLSAEECMVLVPEALALGVTRVIVNHPDMSCVSMSVGDQRKLAALDGVWLERVYVMTLPHVGFRMEDMAEVIRAVGVENTVLATDLGQANHIDPFAGMSDFLQRLAQLGFSPDELKAMTCDAPAAALNLNGTGDRDVN